ncbi:MAG: helix-turn-helix domain-containing protein [Planctomycetes bacterium]|nr:helix-turn-helix domain-containing protein [Planctomycetota bacterium]MCW8134237.1 helix-turn-helix domain-containing protein [Planctomycetota bacterium]
MSTNAKRRPGRRREGEAKAANDGESLPRQATAAIKGRFTMLPEWLRRCVGQGALTWSAIGVWHALASFRNHDTGACFPSQARLASEAGLTRRSIQAHLNALERVGAVRKRRRGRTSNQYDLCFDAKPFAQENAKPAAQESAKPVAQESAKPAAHELEPVNSKPVNQPKRTRARTATAVKDNYLLTESTPPQKSAVGVELDRVKAVKEAKAISVNNRRALDQLLAKLPDCQGLSPGKLAVKGLRLRCDHFDSQTPAELQTALEEQALAPPCANVAELVNALKQRLGLWVKPAIEFPEDLKEYEPELREWLAYKKEKHQKCPLEELIQAARALGPNLPSAIDFSMGNNYNVLVEEPKRRKG